MGRVTLIMLIVWAWAAGTCLAGVNKVSITDIWGTFPNHDLSAQLAAGAPHVLEITFDATDGVGYTWLGTNSFELYSPDGADWVYLMATRGQYIMDLPLKYTPSIGCQALESFLKHSYKQGGTGTFVTTPPAGQIEQCFTGLVVDDPYTTLPAGGNVNGNDTVGFYHGLVGTGAGYPGGTSGEALYVEFRSLSTDNGRHLCFDTTRQIQAWEWAASGYPLNSGSDYPDWDNGLGYSGPICWEIYQLPCGYIVWFDGQTSDNLVRADCQDISYQLSAEGHTTEPGWELEYALAPPYANGLYGSVDPETGLWTCPAGTLLPGEHQIKFWASAWCVYSDPFVLNVTVIDNSENTDCCVGRVGDANHSGDDEPTIGDVATLIDALFVREDACILLCLAEADINQSGSQNPQESDITIGDVSMLLDYLFISNPRIGLPDCLPME